jgi:hypothetical protein
MRWLVAACALIAGCLWSRETRSPVGRFVTDVRIVEESLLVEDCEIAFVVLARTTGGFPTGRRARTERSESTEADACLWKWSKLPPIVEAPVQESPR